MDQAKKRLTCIVADDEMLIAQRIARLAEAEGFEVQRICANGAEAFEAIVSLKPHVAFLDIQMPGMSGLDVLDRLEAMDRPPAIILITAYDEHAVAAFALAATDYVLKPVARGRFKEAATRARQTVTDQQSAQQLARLRGALRPASVDTIWLRDGSRIMQIEPAAISRIEAADDYAIVHVDGAEHLLPLTLRALETVLPTPPFVRAHRSHIVNINKVSEMVPTDGKLVLRLDDIEIPVSRARALAVRQRITSMINETR